MKRKIGEEPIAKDAPTHDEVSELIDCSMSIESNEKAFCALLTICRKNNTNLDKIRMVDKNVSCFLSRERRTIRENKLKTNKKREESLGNNINDLQNQVSKIYEYSGADDLG